MKFYHSMHVAKQKIILATYSLNRYSILSDSTFLIKNGKLCEKVLLRLEMVWVGCLFNFDVNCRFLPKKDWNLITGAYVRR